LRFVDELPAQSVPHRAALDVSIGWQATDALRLSLTVRNLNDDTHLEFGGSNVIERNAYLRATWSPTTQ
jgi:outer membrane receptor protein involved in Fe transport